MHIMILYFKEALATILTIKIICFKIALHRVNILSFLKTSESI